MNTLYYGDNLDILRHYVQAESVDLIYLDPPFKSNRDYNILFQERDGSQSAAQIKAFEDTWSWNQEAARLWEETVEEGPPDLAAVLRAFRVFPGETDMLAYLANMAPRLLELRRVLKPTGTLYLHCDPTASHYLKILLDAVFGPTRFRNEIVWCYAGGGIPRKDFPRKHDVILRYTKGDEYYYSPVYRPYSEGTVQRGRTKVKGKYYEKGLREEGTPVNDWWPDVPKVTSPTSREKLGYPTQKSEALLERIIRASSEEGALVLDPFCGCGTAVAVSERLGRPWIGIDITHLSINLIKYRLRDTFGDDVEKTYEVLGEPVSLPDARQLAAEDPYQFEFWALSLVGARPAEKKKGADRGIDGRLLFHDQRNGKTKQVLFSVKGGRVGVAQVRDLRGVIERENAEIGVFISMRSPTNAMEREAASAGFYESAWGRHPRIQLLTIEQLLAGKRVDRPPTRADVTFRRASRASANEEQMTLD